MATRPDDSVFRRVRAHAFGTLSFERRQTTNLHLDEHIYDRGETIGPEFQRIVAQRPSILVFADDNPRANFGHDCRYLLYDAATGAFERQAPARFPPIADAKQPKTLRAFHEPVRFDPNPILFHPFPPHHPGGDAIRDPLLRHVEQTASQRHGIPLPDPGRHLCVRPCPHPGPEL